MSPEKDLILPPPTPGLSVKMTGLFLDEEECLCGVRSGEDGQHHHQAGYGGDAQDVEDRDECLC